MAVDQHVKLRCPACRSKQNLDVTGIYTEERCWEVRGGVITLSYLTGALGDHIQTNAKCNECGHKWRVRGESWRDEPADGDGVNPATKEADRG